MDQNYMKASSHVTKHVYEYNPQIKSIFTIEVAQVSKTKEESATGAFESQNHADFFLTWKG
jgi:hypothetical protein